MPRKKKVAEESVEKCQKNDTVQTTPTYTIIRSGSTDYMFLQIDVSLKKDTMEAEIVEIKEIARCSKHLAIDKLRLALSYYIRDL